MSTNIDIKFSVEDAAAFKAWQRQQAAAAKMRKELDALKNSGNAAGANISAAANKAISGLGGAVAAFAGVSGIVTAIQALVSQLQAEIANIRSRQTAAGGTQIEFGKEMADLLDNLGGLMEPLKVRQRVIDIAQKYGQDPTAVTQVIKSQAAAIGPQTPEEADKLFETAGPLMQSFPHLDKGEQAQSAAAVGSMGQNAGLNPLESIGALKAMQQQHHSDDVKMLVTNAIPAVSQLEALGATTQEALGLLSSFSQKMEDSRGDTSKTAAVGLLKYLAVLLPEEKDFKSRMEKVQSDPALQKIMLEGGEYKGKKHEKMSMEQGAYVTTTDRIKGGEHHKDYVGRTASIGGKQRWETLAKKSIDDFNSLPEIQNMQMQNRLKAATSGIQLERSAEGTSGILTDELANLLKAAGMSDLAQKIGELKVELSREDGKLKVAAAVKMIRQHAESLENPVGVVEPAGDSGFGPTAAVYGPRPDLATQEGLATAAKERQLADALEAGAPGLQAAQSNVVVENARSKVDDLKKLQAEIKADDNFTAEERKAAQARLEQGNLAVRGLEAANKTAPGGGDAASKVLIEQGKQQIMLLEKLIQATQGNAPKPAAGAPASPSGIQQRPRNNQASRAYNRGAGPLGGGTQMS